MINHKLMKRVLGGVGVILVLNAIFVYLDLYWIVPELDLAMHALAGSILAFFAIAFMNEQKLVRWSVGGFLRRLSIILFVAVVAISWEFVERYFGLSIALSESLLDAQSDVWAGLVGAFLAYLRIHFHVPSYKRYS